MNPVAELSKEYQLAFILRVMSTCDGFNGVGPDDLFWRVDAEYAPLTFFVRCNDLFRWGCSDLEEVTPGNIALLEKTIADCESVDDGAGSLYAAELFCCRSRKMRPQRKAYPSREKYPILCAMFDECGPERDPKDEG